MGASRKFFHPTSKRTGEFQLARMMMVLVVVFLLLNCPRLVLGLIEVTQLSTVELCYQHGLDFHIHKITYLLDFTARFLVILNSSVNFIIYCVAGSQFRHKLMAILNIPSQSATMLFAKMNLPENLGEEIPTEPLEITLSRKNRYILLH